MVTDRGAMLSLREAADMLGMSQEQAYRMARAGEFPAPVFRRGNRWKVLRRDVEQVLALPAPPPAHLSVVPSTDPALAHIEANLRAAEQAVAFWTMQRTVYHERAAVAAQRSA